jgi:hypothetical protein
MVLFGVTIDDNSLTGAANWQPVQEKARKEDSIHCKYLKIKIVPSNFRMNQILWTSSSPAGGTSCVADPTLLQHMSLWTPKKYVMSSRKLHVVKIFL